MNDKLAEICTAKHSHVAAQKKMCGDADIKAAIAAQSTPRGFVTAIRNTIDTGHWALIAEIKRASPSKGLIRENFSPAEHARDYQLGGATCLSILTDVPYFQGHDDYLLAARKATTLPCLRKDFMVDPWQVAESRSLGADAILIIAAACDDTLIAELCAASQSHNMDILVEVHNRAELDRALALNLPLQNSLIGINNRNLKQFVTDLAITEDLVQHIPKRQTIISESGIANHSDCQRLARSGVNAFLVGETLMRQDNVRTATEKLLNG